VKNSRAPLFFRASAGYSKLLNNKKYLFNTVKNIRAPSVFQGKDKLLKNYECKGCIPYSEEFLGNSVFQGKRKLIKSPECITYIQYSEKFQGSSVFQGKRRLLKTPE